MAITVVGRADEATIKEEGVSVASIRGIGSGGPVVAVLASAEELLSVGADNATPHKE